MKKEHLQALATLMGILCFTSVGSALILGPAFHAAHLNRIDLLNNGKPALAKIVSKPVEFSGRGARIDELQVIFPTDRGWITGARPVSVADYESAKIGDRVPITFTEGAPGKFVLGHADQEFPGEQTRIDLAYIWYAVALIVSALMLVSLSALLTSEKKQRG